MIEAAFWSTASGQALLGEFREQLDDTGGDTQAAVMRFKNRKSGDDPTMLNQTVEIVLGRQKATEQRFPIELIEKGLVTPQMVEQSSRSDIANYHAKPFADQISVLEIGTGSGMDTLALSRQAEKVITIERDARIADWTRWNLQLLGVNNVEILEGSFDQLRGDLRLEEFSGIWCDPSRRDESGNRVFSPKDYSPNLRSLLQIDRPELVGIKVSPGLRVSDLPLAWTTCWVGYENDCVEQTLWRGTGHVEGEVQLYAPEFRWLPKAVGRAPEIQIEKVMAEPSQYYLVEPHPAIVRCGFVGSFFAEHGLAVFDDRIAYGLTESEPENSPAYTAYRLVDCFWMGFKELSRSLSERGWDSGTQIKKRGYPEAPETVWKKLKLPSPTQTSSSGVILLSRAEEKHIAFLAHPAGGEND